MVISKKFDLKGKQNLEHQYQPTINQVITFTREKSLHINDFFFFFQNGNRFTSNVLRIQEIPLTSSPLRAQGLCTAAKLNQEHMSLT